MIILEVHLYVAESKVTSICKKKIVLFCSSITHLVPTYRSNIF